MKTLIFLPWKIIWRVNVPTKVAFLMWTAASGNIHTMDNLLKRNICIVGWCCMFNSVATMGSLLPICFFTVIMCKAYGYWCFNYMDSSGLCLRG